MSSLAKRINRMDLLLLLLFADGRTESTNEPIEGKTRLQKELFLSQKNLKDHRVEKPYSFRPYHYGPYCKDIYSDIDWLKDEGIIVEKQQTDAYGGVLRIFSLTKSGINEVKELLGDSEIFKQYEMIREVKKAYNSMSVVKLVEYTHNAYSDYVGPR